MAEALRKRIWAARLSWTALLLSGGAIAASLIAAVGSGQGAWHFRVGFTVLQYSLFAAAAGVVIAVIAWALARRSAQSRLGLVNLFAILLGVGFLFYLGNQIATARSVPAIHDVATNLDDIPKFYRLVVRADNLKSIPDLGRPGLAALPPRERWKAVHREAYGDLRTVRVPWNVPETIERAEALARERGWEVVTSDPRLGILEAVDTSFFFRFKDNVLVRVRPAPGGGSLVDMRSISRVGGSDVGVNAKRIRSFLSDLQQS
jgi:hypothetical protein